MKDNLKKKKIIAIFHLESHYVAIWMTRNCEYRYVFIEL